MTGGRFRETSVPLDSGYGDDLSKKAATAMDEDENNDHSGASARLAEAGG
jgi:hypothetical protein